MAVTVDLSDFNKDMQKYINKLLPQGVEKGLSLGAELVRSEASKNAPYDSGYLGLNINKEIKRTAKGFSAYVGTNVKYAIYVHEGTGIYTKGGSLAKKIPWFVPPRGGKPGFMTKGNKPNPFIVNSLNQNKTKVRELIQRGLSNA